MFNVAAHHKSTLGKVLGRACLQLPGGVSASGLTRILVGQVHTVVVLRVYDGEKAVLLFGICIRYTEYALLRTRPAVHSREMAYASISYSQRCRPCKSATGCYWMKGSLQSARPISPSV